MYPSISSEFQKESSYATSSAPPQPHFSSFEDAVATGIPVPLGNQNNHDPSRPRRLNNASHSLSSGPWSTSLCDCFSDLNSSRAQTVVSIVFARNVHLCQEYRELKNRGFDLSIGWHGNMERQKRLAAATAPPTEERMMR
ncbi:hypothetical protein OIU77_014107 [Salix suchowensis]|uniref:Uncharacterized protein n=1 Tax=Salix suchowensis TaxID=1278906 RepID=A0ABQ8ZWY6_9ROSI|nr:hypothetical protein OIU77_014107 [Salix suchowensis]